MGPDIQMEQQGASFARGMGRIFERACALLHDYRPRLTHLGLLGVQERVKLLEGRVEIESASGRGTTVRLHIPIV